MTTATDLRRIVVALAALATLALDARRATAIDAARIAYLIDQREYQRARVAVTFAITLYRDADCSDAVASRSVPATSIDLMEEVRTLGLHGVRRVRPLRIVELLTGLAVPDQPLFVRMSGVGVVPVGRSCQLAEPLELAGSELPSCIHVDGSNLVVDGCDLRIQSGSGASAGTPNGRGNLLLGYGELCTGDGCPTGGRSGSHVLAIGAGHAYEARGGLLAGYGNAISGSFAAVAGGRFGLASGSDAVVVGGVQNVASGAQSAVLGGSDNAASGRDAAIGGGQGNLAGGEGSVVVGGRDGEARGTASTVLGGERAIAGGEAALVLGGEQNLAAQAYAAVGGGVDNLAAARSSTVAGGRANLALTESAVVYGGSGRSESSQAPFVCGDLD